MADAVTSTAPPGLRRDAIGLREVLFQSMTDMAPGAAIAASIPFGVGYAGGALPLSVLIALVACLLTAFCIGELAKNLPGAGSLGLYVSQGLHTSLGFLTSWGYLLDRADDLAVGAAAARFHDGVDDPFRVVELPGRSVVAVDDPRHSDRGRCRAVRHSHVRTAGYGARPVRDRGLPRARGVLRRARRQPQHAVGLHHQVHADRLPRDDRRHRRIGVRVARLRRLRGRDPARGGSP